MVAERESTAEKQLLNLIEKSQPGDIRQAAVKRAGFSLFSWGALKGRFSFFLKKVKDSLSSERKPLDIKRINAILGAGVFTLVGYFVISSTILALNLEKSLTLSSEIKVSRQGITSKTASPLKKLSYYLEKVRTRDIFNPLTKVVEPTETGEQSHRVGFKIAEATKDLKLVGISWSNDPDAMIEDRGQNRVYFLKKGEAIGKIRIVAIFKDKVVLSYEGEELELR